MIEIAKIFAALGMSVVLLLLFMLSLLVAFAGVPGMAKELWTWALR